MASLYKYVEVAKVAKRKWRLSPAAMNGQRFPQYKTHMFKWTAQRASRRMYPGVPMMVVNKMRTGRGKWVR